MSSKENAFQFVINKNGLGHEYFLALKRNSHKIAQFLADTEETETFAQVLQKSIRTALKLSSLGIKRGDVVCLNSYNQGNACIPIIASQFLKCTFASLDPQLSPEETVHLLKLVKPKIIFLSENAIKQIEDALAQTDLQTILVTFQETSKYIPFSDFLAPSEEENNFLPVTEGTNEDVAIIFFSSGTTGLPKGVCITHRTVLTQIVYAAKFFCLHNDFELSYYSVKGRKEDPLEDVLVIYSPFYWISATMFLNSSLFLGAPRLVAKQFNSTKFFEQVEKYKVTQTFMAPTFAAELTTVKDAMKYDRSSLKILWVGGSCVSEKCMNSLKTLFPKTKILNVYGCTEIGGFVSGFGPTNEEECRLQLKNPTSCGRFNDGLSWRIVDPDTEEVLGVGQTGEVRVKCGDLELCKYLNVDSSASFDANGYLKMGDLGYVDEDGCVFLIGRIKEVLKYKGWHISPEFIEEVLCKHESVKEAVVFGIPHETEGEHPMALVVLKPNQNVNVEDLQKFVDERVIERHRLRAGIKIVEKIPKGITGKVKRSVIKDMVLNKQI